MKKSDSISHLNKLNSIINGSKNIIDSIDQGKTINIEKSIKASMLNSIKLAEELKYIITQLTVDDYKSNPNSNDDDAVANLMHMFGMK